MTIPEHKLQAWSKLGSQTASASTYSSIKTALKAHDWPYGMNHTVYLQGSYPNHTNIRGDSDVDVVVETSNAYYHDLITYSHSGSYDWRQFRDEVKCALTNYFGSNKVRESRNGKCIKVEGSQYRLNADVVPCATFKRFEGLSHIATGITFWTNSGTQIINYPKLHLKNGSLKNTACGDRFKPNVRVFKNARSEMDNNFPSYFLECLIYNVPKECFSEHLSLAFLKILTYLLDAISDGSLKEFRCQNEQQKIFGYEQHQIKLSDAVTLINELVALWTNWK